MKKSKNTISGWLKEHGDPTIDRFVDKNMAIVEKVRCALESKGWSKADFAKVMDKNPSEISKWLSGMHNFTLKSITNMGEVLEIDLIRCNLKSWSNNHFIEEVEYTLKSKGWTKRKFAEAMDKRPSEVSKWFCGTHNFTLKSIIKIENVLGVDLISCDFESKELPENLLEKSLKTTKSSKKYRFASLLNTKISRLKEAQYTKDCDPELYDTENGRCLINSFA